MVIIVYYMLIDVPFIDMLNGSTAVDYSLSQLKRNKIGAATKLISYFNKCKHYFQVITEFNRNKNSEKITGRSFTFIPLLLVETNSNIF